MPSTITVPMVVRLPKADAEKVVKRAKRLGISTSEYLRRILVRQLSRKR